MKVDKSWVGKKVRALDKDEAFAPYKGAVETVLEFDGEDENVPCKVLWDDDQSVMWAVKGSIELVEDDSTLMSYDEIWEMLRPKMEKNGFHSYVCRVFNYELERYERTEFYTPEDFQKAVALAYKMGYERAMKGRPFKYGEKKVKKVEGHWEKVDPENLPKDGTRVRYAREYVIYNNDLMVVDEGNFEDYTFVPDARLHRLYHHYYFIGHCDKLDYWVEGDDAD